MIASDVRPGDRLRVFPGLPAALVAEIVRKPRSIEVRFADCSRTFYRPAASVVVEETS